MIDVLFINPNLKSKAYQKLSDTYSTIEPPTWSLLLAKSIISKGFSSEILDLEALNFSSEQALSEIEYLKPKLITFVLYGQNPNSGTTSMIGSLELAKKIKEGNHNAKICFIGSHVSALPREVLKNSQVDFILFNEGVYGLLELLETNFKDNLNNVSSLGYKEDSNLIINPKGKVVSLDRMDQDLPGYAWDLLPKKTNDLDLYRASYWHSFFSEKDRTPFAAVYSSLGCMFACNFCMINILNRTNNDESQNASNFKGMRFWSPEFFLNQLEDLANRGVKTLRLSDEMFFLNKKYYIPILEGIIKRGLDFNIWAYARVDSVREDQLELFKKAGVEWLALGIEAGNQNVRLEIEKGRFKDVNIRSVVSKIKDHDINVLGNYIFGFPEDTSETMNETLNLAIELNTEHANFYACQALPGSPLYQQAKNNNWYIPEKYEEFAFLSYEAVPLPTKYLTSSEVLKFRDDAWHKYFSNKDFLNLVEKKFGTENKDNVIEMSKIRLKRKILGD